ncbi:hypothetical protein N2K95_04005 [Arthrobacter zhaoxinii]|uniref:Uncharacterized protein n=1 Tax=Arthrobacter zhaoxinii TaxID=2964616 RepID=A0ABY5YUV5_9MICC|nr:hypothetical protein [Arthrobacter zhaoxinii]UWX97858.1 hypothetical protein N2K95_04005 [Arthrobacter zhaoxinii]
MVETDRLETKPEGIIWDANWHLGPHSTAWILLVDLSPYIAISDDVSTCGGGSTSRDAEH